MSTECQHKRNGRKVPCPSACPYQCTSRYTMRGKIMDLRAAFGDFVDLLARSRS